MNLLSKACLAAVFFAICSGMLRTQFTATLVLDCGLRHNDGKNSPAEATWRRSLLFSYAGFLEIMRSGTVLPGRWANSIPVLEIESESLGAFFVIPMI